MNKSRQLLADIMLVVVLCVAAVMAELQGGDGDRWRQFAVPTAGLGAVLIVGLIIMALQRSKDAPTES